MGANPIRKRKRKPAVRHSLPDHAPPDELDFNPGTEPLVTQDELDFNPDVEPLVTQLLNRDPKLVYPAHINPILGSTNEPPQFRLGLSRREKKELETLREMHEEKMAERNIPVSSRPRTHSLPRSLSRSPRLTSAHSSTNRPTSRSTPQPTSTLAASRPPRACPRRHRARPSGHSPWTTSWRRTRAAPRRRSSSC
jgi:hypothetical protein